MTITIAHSGGTISPTLVLGGYETRRSPRSTVHQVIGRADPDITFTAPASLRTGTLQLFFLTSATALDCEAAHALTRTFTLSDSDVPSAAMTYVPAGGDIVTRLDPGTGRWTVTVPFQEVKP